MNARSCATCAVRARALCAALNDEELAGLAAQGVQRTLGRGDTLLHAGDERRVCANIQSGLMKVASVTADGDEAIVGLAYAGDFVGRPFAGTAEQDVVALTDVTLCAFPVEAVEAALRRHPDMERELLTRTLDDLDSARRWLVRLAHASAGARVAGFLLDMAKRLGAAEGETVQLPVSRGEIADLLGLTIETVSRQVTRLRAAGIIDLPGGRGLVICDMAALAAEA